MNAFLFKTFRCFTALLINCATATAADETRPPNMIIKEEDVQLYDLKKRP
jgi:hypothetical protein